MGGDTPLLEIQFSGGDGNIRSQGWKCVCVRGGSVGAGAGIKEGKNKETPAIIYPQVAPTQQ